MGQLVTQNSNFKSFSTPRRRHFQLLSLVYKVLSVIAMEPKTQIAGVTVIVDCANFGYHQFKNLSFDDVRIVSMFAQVSKFHH